METRIQRGREREGETPGDVTGGVLGIVECVDRRRAGTGARRVVGIEETRTESDDMECLLSFASSWKLDNCS